jgi:DNA-binding XRE family transcriptional regulator
VKVGGRRRCRSQPAVAGLRSERGAALTAATLRRLRAAAGISQEDLAQRISYSASLVGMVETARRAPARDFAERCDVVLSTGGTLARL